MNSKRHRNSVLTAGVVLGVGMGGFVDGILFHQIIQTHNMLSAIHFPDTLVNAEINMFWDGLFHVFTWITTAIGLAILWRGVHREDSLPTTRSFLGALSLGWGFFNVVEGVIDHHILHLHHVVERLGISAWDYAFLGSGVMLVLVGFNLMRGKEGAEISAEVRPVGFRS